MRHKIALFLLVMTSFLSAEEEPFQRQSYGKIGVAFPPMPTIGIGTRFQSGHRGFDLSANIDSLLVFNYIEIKGLYLYYPQPDANERLYYGLGSGLAYRLNLSYGSGIYHTQNASQGIIPIDFVVGKEFRNECFLDSFVQLEISQPVINFTTHADKGSYTPRIAVTFGKCF